jgi:hypothetical protein
MDTKEILFDFIKEKNNEKNISVISVDSYFPYDEYYAVKCVCVVANTAVTKQCYVRLDVFKEYLKQKTPVLWEL